MKKTIIFGLFCGFVMSIASVSQAQLQEESGNNNEQAQSQNDNVQFAPRFLREEPRNNDQQIQDQGDQGQPAEPRFLREEPRIEQPAQSPDPITLPQQQELPQFNDQQFQNPGQSNPQSFFLREEPRFDQPIQTPAPVAAPRLREETRNDFDQFLPQDSIQPQVLDFQQQPAQTRPNTQLASVPKFPSPQVTIPAPRQIIPVAPQRIETQARIATVSPQSTWKLGYEGQIIVDYGMRVLHTEYNSPAAQAGLSDGDIIVRINGRNVGSPEGYNAALLEAANHYNGKLSMTVRTIRGEYGYGHDSQYVNTICWLPGYGPAPCHEATSTCQRHAFN